MSRFEDTPALFGIGVGRSTCGDIQCEWCETLYNEGEDKRESYDNDSVRWVDFGGKIVCECCFERVEKAIFTSRRDIIPWLKRRVEILEHLVATDMGLLEDY